MKRNKILIILPARLGDTLFCTPAMQFLHKHFPHIVIDAITMTKLSAEVIAHNPAIHQIIIAPSLRQLKKIQFDYLAAICLHNDAVTKKITDELNIPTFIAPIPDMSRFQAQQALEFVQSILPKIASNSPDLQHPAINLTECRITAEDQRYFLFPQNEHQQKIIELLKKENVNFKEDILIGCHLGCHSIAKRNWKFWKRREHRRAWPLANFISLEQKLRMHNPQCRLVLTGSQNEMSLAQEMQKAAPRSINLIDKTSVLELAALMKYFKVFLTGDTGPLHVACAAGINVVAMYGYNIHARLYPYPPREADMLLHGTTVSDIPIEEVLSAVKHFISKVNY